MALGDLRDFLPGRKFYVALDIADRNQLLPLSGPYDTLGEAAQAVDETEQIYRADEDLYIEGAGTIRVVATTLIKAARYGRIEQKAA